MSTPVRILLIDDNPDDRALVLRELTREFPGLQVEQVGDPKGFERALQGGNDFDLVVTDYQLRWTDGLAVLRTVKERDARTPIIMFTGTGSEEIAVEAMKGGLDDYVLKSPKHFPRLRAAVRLALERGRHHRDLAEAETRYRELFEEVPSGLFRCTVDGRLLDANATLVALLGYPDRDALLAVPAPSRWVDPERRRVWTTRLEQEDVVRDFEHQVRRGDGRVIWARTTARAVRDPNGNLRWLEGSVEDITGQKQARDAVEKLAAFSRSNPNPVVEFSADGRLTYVNDAARALAATVGGEGPEAILPETVVSIIEECLASGNPRLGVETQVGERTLTWSIIPVAGGRVALGYAFDISERVHLERQLRQAQKMEAVGRLAGGVAHDFNNLLTVITGYCELLLNRVDADDPLRHEVDEIKKAGERAASLTRQLLAFSRRQVLQPRVLDLNVVVAEMEKMLRRVIGEDIELSTHAAGDLGRVKADPGQIEQVILNLAVNARDAMPSGGRLTLQTDNVTLDETEARRRMGAVPGRYVMLVISDTGKGMDAETQAHLFEPFYTTKEQGKGTGLGLAMVYGIIRQSGGNIWVSSEVDKGTTFKIYLPYVQQPADAMRPAGARTRAPGGTETILVVEDEEVVRVLVRDILRRHGYTVVEAPDGPHARLMSMDHLGPIHLLLTDIVMPRMGGRELASILAPSRPEMRILYMSGYTDDEIVHHGVKDDGAPFLQKPFTPDALAFKVREVLDAAERPSD
jgi:two-component system, cell cycle sensor histidine kinase and response regulator CckA